MKVKLNWIYQAEERLGLIKTSSHDGIVPHDEALTAAKSWKGLAFPRPLSTSGLTVDFYALLVAVDLIAIAVVRTRPQ